MKKFLNKVVMVGLNSKQTLFHCYQCHMHLYKFSPISLLLSLVKLGGENFAGVGVGGNPRVPPPLYTSMHMYVYYIHRQYVHVNMCGEESH